MTTLTDIEIEEIIGHIQGSCLSLDQAIVDVTEDKVDGLDAVTNWRELCDRLDQRHFLCSVCGWWTEAGNYADGDDDVCADCGEDDDEEED